MKIWAIAKVGFKECLRYRIFYFILVMAILFIFLGKSCTPKLETGNTMLVDIETQQNVAMEAGFHGIIFWSMMLCGLLSAGLLTREEEEGTAAMTLSRPLSRAQFLTGKIVSVLMVSVFNLFLLAGVFLLLFYVELGQFNPNILLSFLVMVVSLIVYCLMTLFLSFFMPRMVAPLVSMFIYLLNIWITLPYHFDKIKLIWVPSRRVEVLYAYLPKFGDIQFFSASFIAMSAKSYDIIPVFINFAVYSLLFWFVILFLFNKRAY